MPKDPTKNVDRYKIRGGVINEYQFHENQQALAQNEPQGEGKLIPGTPPEGKAATKVTEPLKATESTKTKTAAKKATRNVMRGASAKKLAARKAAKKSF